MIIYITGIDGSGKSTIIQLLAENYFSGTRISSIRGAYEIKLLKPFSKIIRGKIVKSSINYNNISENDYNKWKKFKHYILKNKIINFFFYSIQAFDYLLQIRKIEMQHIRKSNALIIDRFILDFLVNQSIYYGDITNRKLTKILLNKLNLVDLIIYLDVDINNAFKRKDDIPSVEFLEERKKYYLQFINTISNFYIVNNNGNIENTVNQITERLKLYENNYIRH